MLLKRTISVIVPALMLVTCIFIQSENLIDEAAAKTANISISNYTAPTALYKGSSFSLRGTISSSSKLTKVSVGIADTKGKFISGKYVTVNPKSKTYNIKKIDSKIKFGKLSAGTYRYKVYARNAAGTKKTLINKTFTVSYIKIKSASKPSSSIKLGKSVSLKGTISSTYKLKNVKVGITNSSGSSWKKGYYVSKNPKSKSFSIAAVDSKIKFGKLSKGTYRYVVKATDIYGKTKKLVNYKFKVVNTASIQSSGYTLSYKKSVISNIGKQKISGPCGLYAMAYARAVIDGSFSKGKYSTYYSKLYNVYGCGSNCAYWYKAGGESCYYSSNKSRNQNALQEILDGKPCIINLHNNGTGNNHYVTVIGYVKGTTYSNVSLKKFIVLDPSYGTVKYLKNMNYSNSGNPQLITF